MAHISEMAPNSVQPPTEGDHLCPRSQDQHSNRSVLHLSHRVLLGAVTRLVILKVNPLDGTHVPVYPAFFTQFHLFRWFCPCSVRLLFVQILIMPFFLVSFTGVCQQKLTRRVQPWSVSQSQQMRMPGYLVEGIMGCLLFTQNKDYRWAVWSPGQKKSCAHSIPLGNEPLRLGFNQALAQDPRHSTLVVWQLSDLFHVEADPLPHPQGQAPMPTTADYSQLQPTTDFFREPCRHMGLHGFFWDLTK
jgi:hypothetical protein